MQFFLRLSPTFQILSEDDSLKMIKQLYHKTPIHNESPVEIITLVRFPIHAHVFKVSGLNGEISEKPLNPASSAQLCRFLESYSTIFQKQQQCMVQQNLKLFNTIPPLCSLHLRLESPQAKKVNNAKPI
jgi:hypothetical protein